MDVNTAIGILQELVGRGTTINLIDGRPESGPPFVVAQIDYLAGQESRCIVSRTDRLGIYRSLRRPVVDITRERKYLEADGVLAAAPLAELRLAVEQFLMQRHVDPNSSRREMFSVGLQQRIGP